jgi:glycosyltransferase involved in cell wall biosynthesis
MDDYRNAEYLDRFAPTMMIVHKMPTAISFGIRSIRAFSGRKVMELHDDFPARYKEISQLLLRPQYTAGKEAKLYGNLTKVLRYAPTRVSEMRIKGEEAYAINSFDRLLVASTVEYGSYRKRTDLTVEIEFFPWPALAFRGSNSPVSQQTSKAEYDLGFIASDELFNIDAAKYLLRDLIPKLRSRGIEIRTLICGGVVDGIVRDDLDEGVTLLRRVESVEEFYSKINLAVAPLRAGTGVSIKVLEALAFHRPVLGTPIGLRGLTPELRRFTVEFSSPDGFVDAVRSRQVRSGGASALSATLEQDLREFERRMDGLVGGRGARLAGAASSL